MFKKYILTGGLITIPFVLWLLPADFFDQGPTLCVSKLIFESDCPGCGMTRAVQHAMHLDFAASWGYNKLFIIVLPLLIYLWIKQIKKLVVSN